jgi:hypothetical protein
MYTKLDQADTMCLLVIYFCRLNSLLKDFNIFVLKFSSLLEFAEFLSLFPRLAFSWLADGNGSGEEFVALVLGVAGVGIEAVGVVSDAGAVISLIHTAPETK